MDVQNSLLWKIATSETLEAPVYLSDVTAWHGHIPFAFWLGATQCPEVFVELGVHFGDSLMAFLQQLSKSGCHHAMGVDTFTGDDQTGFYSPTVYASLKEIHDPLYGKFSRLERKLFDEAAVETDDGTVDLLHLDGRHDYESVEHDLKVWLPKLSKRGILLMHDTRVTGFGVRTHFEKLSRVYPAFEFHHCNGLGMLLVGREQKDVLRDLCHQNHTEIGEWARDYFALFGDRVHKLQGAVARLRDENGPGH